MQHCFSLSRKSRDFWGPRWASQSQIAKIAAISVRWGHEVLQKLLWTVMILLPMALSVLHSKEFLLGSLFWNPNLPHARPNVSVATPAEPHGEYFMFANFGRWKTFRKVPVRHFWAAWEGHKLFRTGFGSFFGSFFTLFKPWFVSI